MNLIEDIPSSISSYSFKSFTLHIIHLIFTQKEYSPDTYSGGDNCGPSQSNLDKNII